MIQHRCLGALFGAINTMYAAVATRAREIATLRAVGFQRLPIAASIMCEALSLSLAGSLAWAMGYVLLLGLLSSVLPCIRALRAPIPQGLFAS